MKVLKNNYNKECVNNTKQYLPYPRKLICENCGSELEYEKSDLKMGVYGCMHIKCPLCEYGNMIDDNECNIDLTVDNIQFPIHFHHISTETGAVDCCNNKEIRERIQKAINYFRKYKDEESLDYESMSGNLFLRVRRYSGDENYHISISNDYYHTYIPFQDEDY